MISKLSGWNDTIVALATPPGVGAIGVIRLSGQKAIEIVDDLFASKNLKEQNTHTLHVGILKDENIILDEVVISLYKNPRSYTGEDVVEISCHGSPYVQQQVIKAIINKGARLAKPGEFTQRAFLNKKLDLTQAEGVGDLIASNTQASQNAAIQNMRGGFSDILKNLREQLIAFSSLIELELDFSEEDVEFADRKSFYELTGKISVATKNLLASFKLGNVIKNGVNVAIIGKPNTGKSTLLNTLLNENRAIVSDIAGTTRDTIEEILNIEGLLFRLIDTAGIREHSADIIENIGMNRSLEKMKQADIVLYLFDATSFNTSDFKKIKDQISETNKNYLLVINKTDAVNKENLKAELKQEQDVILISAKENSGIDDLKKELFIKATGNESLTENFVVTNARHYEALQKIEKSVEDINEGMKNNLPGDLLALDIRTCLYHLGEITGDITNEDRLDYIFSKFCIGK